MYFGEDRSVNLVKVEDRIGKATVHRVTLIIKNINTV